MRNMKKINEICLVGGKRYCELTFEEARKYGVLTGIAQSAKKGTCGDSHAFSGLKDGRYLRNAVRRHGQRRKGAAGRARPPYP